LSPLPTCLDRADTLRRGELQLNSTESMGAPTSQMRQVRRWLMIVAIGAVLAGLAAFLISVVLPPTYRATAQLFVAPATDTALALQDATVSQNLARSYVQLAGADVVLEPAMKRVDWTDLKTFRDRTTIAQVRDTFVITVSFQLNDSARAAAAANAIAETFVARTDALQSRVGGKVTIWQPATAPTDQDSPKIILNTVVAALLGGLFALVWVTFVPFVRPVRAG
jgi:capsular polysaccharide biosynthesis protein